MGQDILDLMDVDRLFWVKRSENKDLKSMYLDRLGNVMSQAAGHFISPSTTTSDPIAKMPRCNVQGNLFPGGPCSVGFVGLKTSWVRLNKNPPRGASFAGGGTATLGGASSVLVEPGTLNGSIGQQTDSDWLRQVWARSKHSEKKKTFH